MPITALDERTALVVIDIQRGVVGMETVHPTSGVVERCARLAKAFRAAGQPVVLVNVELKPEIALKPRADLKPAPRTPVAGFERIVDELEPDPERDIFITKRQWGAFYGTELDLQLRRRKISGIVMCGIATSIGVESTARDAYERGYNLAFASDAMTDLFDDAHRTALDRIFPRMGEIGTSDEIIAALPHRT
jgi:nicotinamidase-related amidase